MRAHIVAAVTALSLVLPSFANAEPTKVHQQNRDKSCTAKDFEIVNDKYGKPQSYRSKKHGYSFPRATASVGSAESSSKGSELEECVISANGDQIGYYSDPIWATHDTCMVSIYFQFLPGLANRLRPAIDGNASNWQKDTKNPVVAAPEVREGIFALPSGRKLSVYRASVKTTGELGSLGQLLFGYARGNDLVMLHAIHPENAFCNTAKLEIGTFINTFPWP